MKKLVIVSSVGLATAVLLTALVTAKDRATLIHFTRNLDPGTGAGQYPAECLGVISTETLPGTKGDKVSWKVKNGNGQNSDDVCPGMDKGQVELHFKTDVMGAAAMKKLKSNSGGNIDGRISSMPSEATMGSHGYQVFYKGLAAGPDPKIIIDCPTCGPPPEDGGKK